MPVPLYKISPKTPLQVFKRMRRILAKPENWTKGIMARNKDNTPAMPTSSDAVCFCIHGARHRALCVTFGDTSILALKVNSILCEIKHDPVLFNDAPKTTHADVLALLDKAIERA